MCGLAGEFIFAGVLRADLAVATAMAARLTHRGPDDAGGYLSPDGRCAIGFRRLKVIDPELSAQPMTSADGQATVAFNGEIYNFRALRDELSSAGIPLKTRGDTEVLPNLYRLHGPAMLERLDGMFAFAIHDAQRGELFLARDRLGKKPLWYAVLADRIIFASEAKALLAHPMLRPEIDPQAVMFYLTLGYVPAPGSIWRNIRKLPAAHWLKVSNQVSQPQRYWSLPERTELIDHSEAVERVRCLLSAAVEKRLTADVPLGVLLSGGIDSSIVAALMARQAGRGSGVKTFTAGFAETRFDERAHAAEVARHLGTQHQSLKVSADQAAGLLDHLVDQYDEPFADSSALPMYMVCQAARQHVTVALTGDGGDEAFGGYDRYRALLLAQSLGPWRYMGLKVASWVLRPFAPQEERSIIRRMLRFAQAVDEVPAMQYFLFRRLFGPGQLAALLEDDFAAGADLAAPQEWFCQLYEGGEQAADMESTGGQFEDEIAYAQRCDILTYLPDDLLVKADIAGMAHALELRCPMLDPAVVSLGLSLPTEYKLREGRGKAILADAFGDLLPASVFERPKTGFGVPIAGWLRKELLNVMQETLLEGPLVQNGWMKRAVLERLMVEHLSGKADHRHRLWALLWLGRWLARHG